ncbi:hypothetical protein HS088_TW18G00164 [Tripterygium wilfordii]|uniref:Tubby C-terminal domain-containing protein n=1 Tax=Tripterygium wilfordii TaxID=458696 RepID=A0A7J7CCM3_TRIWF|nr:hypothetical protein HS088_TW18G00164 [Tripterygium wilfordii]
MPGRDLKGELGSISRRGFDMKFGYGMRSRSQRVPGPRDTLLQCYIKRNRSNQTYYLCLSLNGASNDNGKFLLAARKCRRATCTDYIISLNRDSVSKGSSTYVGKLRANILGTKFTIYDAQPPHPGVGVSKCRSIRLVNMKQVSPTVPAGNHPVAHISYELNVLGSRMGRSAYHEVIMPHRPSTHPPKKPPVPGPKPGPGQGPPGPPGPPPQPGPPPPGPPGLISDDPTN